MHAPEGGLPLALIFRSPGENASDFRAVFRRSLAK